ncbi:hypothetical protein CGGC5_v010306 [Colletotrichum fructicola Nara gc5]|uniref:Uncharacterized protein n=1 Tax=Colletotrichum fructicola (strain Nara gc5) TaxID=1213859 RepID=A0A7J6IUF3_COLFN|nr:hypothetical protein CGGC5_v010306 [Colletotrichum fructicola Nara gc5]
MQSNRTAGATSRFCEIYPPRTEGREPLEPLRYGIPGQGRPRFAGARARRLVCHFGELQTAISLGERTHQSGLQTRRAERLGQSR